MAEKTELEKYFAAFPDPAGLSEASRDAVCANAAVHGRRKRKGILAVCFAAAACAVIAAAVPFGVWLFVPIGSEMNDGGDPAPGTDFCVVYPGEDGPEGENPLAPASWDYYAYAYGEEAAVTFFVQDVPAFAAQRFSETTYACGYYAGEEAVLAHWNVGFDLVISTARAEQDAAYFAGVTETIAGIDVSMSREDESYLYAFERGGRHYYFASETPLLEEIEAFLQNG